MDAESVDDAYFRARDELERHFQRELVAALGEEAWKQEKTAGSTMTLDGLARFAALSWPRNLARARASGLSSRISSEEAIEAGRS